MYIYIQVKKTELEYQWTQEDVAEEKELYKIKKQSLVRGNDEEQARQCPIPGDLSVKVTGWLKGGSCASWRGVGSGAGVLQGDCGPVIAGC